MAYRVELGTQACKYIKKLDNPTRQRFADQIKELAEDPIGNSKPIVNSNPTSRSCRVGGWRIVFSIRENPNVVVIALVMPRGQVYDRS